MAEPRRTSPFAAVLAEPLPQPNDAGCRLKPLANETRWLLRCDSDGAAAAASALGLGAPAMLRQTAKASIVMAGLGPDEWLLRGASGETLSKALGNSHHARVDVSHRLSGVRLSGPAAATTLAGACPLDLYEAISPVGLATRTILGKAEIILLRTATDSFDLLTNRSFADYLWRLLLELGREHALAAEAA